MNTYRITATVTKTYIAEEDITFDVDAENEEKARILAHEEARLENNISLYDSDLDKTSVYVQSVEFMNGIDGDNLTIPRCDKTVDMFKGDK